MRPSVRSWQPPGSSHPGYVSHGRTLMHCTRVVGCQEVVIACSRGLRPRTVGCAARFERIVQDTGHFLMTTGDVFSCVRDGYYIVCIDSVRRVWSSSPGFRLNHEDNNNNSSISCVGTDDDFLSGGV